MKQYESRSFRSAQICKIAGLSPNTLKNWVGRGDLKTENEQSGGWTVYTLRDLLRACAWAEVNSGGVPPTLAVGLVKQIERDLVALTFGHADFKLKDGRFITADVMSRVDDTDEEDAPRHRVSTSNRAGMVYRYKSQLAERQTADGMPSGGSSAGMVINVGLLWERINTIAESVLAETK